MDNSPLWHFDEEFCKWNMSNPNLKREREIPRWRIFPAHSCLFPPVPLYWIKKLYVQEETLMERISKENYYLDIAETVIGRATCLRRCYGAIIVKNDEIISTGYNGAPRGRQNCVDLGCCNRETLNIPQGQRYELCRSVHAEANAIISAARRDMVGGTLYLAGKNAATGELLHDTASCSMCKRMIINAGLVKVIARTGPGTYTVTDVREWVEEDDTLPVEAK